DVCRRAGESAVEFVSGHARLHDVVCVIAPESQGILAALREAVDDSRWLGCDARAIAIASSKRATIRQLQTHGIPTPIPWRDGEPKRSSNAGWVIKPDDGAGAIATLWYASFDAARVELSKRAQCGLAATMEEWVTGEPLSIAMLCRPNGLDVLSLNRQHIVVDAKGSVHYRGVSLAAIEPASERGQRLVTLARHVAIALPGLHGFVGIDVVDHPEKGPVVSEVNPRITCAYDGPSATIR